MSYWVLPETTACHATSQCRHRLCLRGGPLQPRARPGQVEAAAAASGATAPGVKGVGSVWPLVFLVDDVVSRCVRCSAVVALSLPPSLSANAIRLRTVWLLSHPRGERMVYYVTLFEIVPVRAARPESLSRPVPSGV